MREHAIGAGRVGIRSRAHGAAQGACGIFAAVTGEARNAAGGPASIPPLSFRVCERRAVSPDRRTEFRGGTRDILLLELAHRYAGSLANGASVAVQSARPLATDGLPSPNTSVQPTCTPIAIRAAERAQSSGGARAGLGGSRRIETDPKGPRNRGLTLRTFSNYIEKTAHS